MPWPSLRNLARGFALVAGLSEAQAASPLGEEFLVNSEEFCLVWAPSAAGLKGGGFVIVWDGCYHSEDSVVGQLYTARGKRVLDEFRVAYYSGDQANPSLARLTDGGFVVTWQSSRFADIYGQRYNTAGRRVGGEFRVNSYTKRDQSWPSAAHLTDGGFVVAWVSRRAGSLNIYAQGYDSAGERTGREFRVNSYTKNSQWNANVAGLTGGGFVVIWASREQDGSGDGLYGQRYRPSGEPAGAEFRIPANVEFGRVAALKGGRFVVIWHEYRKDGESADVYGQRYTASGEPDDEVFRINSNTAGYQAGGSVTGLKDGGFVVIWTSSGRTDDHSGLYGQQYDAEGKRFGREFLVARKPARGHVYEPSVARLETGGFIVTWTKSDLSGGLDRGIYGRLYSPR